MCEDVFPSPLHFFIVFSPIVHASLDPRIPKIIEKPMVFIGFFDPGLAKVAPRSLQNSHVGRSWSQDGAKITPKWSCWTKLEPSGRVGGAKLRPGGFQVEAKWLPGGAAPAKVASKPA